jgi:hypothetical protein
MTTIMPEGEALRKAVRWISEEREADPEKRLGKLLDEAAVRFNLSPGDSAFLDRFVRESLKKE